MSSCSYTVLLINQEQGARNYNEKEKTINTKRMVAQTI